MSQQTLPEEIRPVLEYKYTSDRSIYAILTDRHTFVPAWDTIGTTTDFSEEFNNPLSALKEAKRRLLNDISLCNEATLAVVEKLGAMPDAPILSKLIKCEHDFNTAFPYMGTDPQNP